MNEEKLHSQLKSYHIYTRRVLHQSSSISALPEHPFFGYVSVAQLVASMSGVVLGGVVMVVGSNLARGKIFTESIGSVDIISLCIYLLYESASVSDPV